MDGEKYNLNECLFFRFYQTTRNVLIYNQIIQSQLDNMRHSCDKDSI